jgi:hypothetical protein
MIFLLTINSQDFTFHLKYKFQENKKLIQYRRIRSQKLCGKANKVETMLGIEWKKKKKLQEFSFYYSRVLLILLYLLDTSVRFL